MALAAENLDAVELGRLLQLVLGCAVKCERKQGMWLLVCYALFVDTSHKQTQISTVYVLYSVDKKGTVSLKSSQVKLNSVQLLSCQATDKGRGPSGGLARENSDDSVISRSRTQMLKI